MSKNSESPISLFSFQDIVTSLTGIMIFFLLVLAISLFDVKDAAVQNPYREELKASRNTLALLKRQNQEYQNDLQTYHRRLQENIRTDAITQKIELFALQEKIKDAKNKLQGEKNRRREAQMEQKVIAIERKKNENREKDLAELTETQKKTSLQIVTLKEANRQLEADIIRRRHSVDITVDGNTNKQPLIIECSGKEIIIGEGVHGNRKTIVRKTPDAVGMIHDAVELLSGYPTEKFYFVFIFKPSSARYADYFKKHILPRIPQAECGFEPILESEGCF